MRRGLPAFAVVGLADAAVREARERVRAAILNCGYEFPQRRITANLAPADVPKIGPGLDPTHPVVALATERIEELSARKSAVADRISTLKAERPAGHDPEEVAAMLDAIPDLSETLNDRQAPKQLTEIFKAFDVTITYDKATERLRLAATITPELLPQNDDDRSGERSQMFGVAGERFVLIGDLSVPIERVVSWPWS